MGGLAGQVTHPPGASDLPPPLLSLLVVIPRLGGRIQADHLRHFPGKEFCQAMPLTGGLGSQARKPPKAASA